MSQQAESGVLLAGMNEDDHIYSSWDDPARNNGVDSQNFPQQARKTVVRRKPVQNDLRHVPSQNTKEGFELLQFNDNVLSTETEGDIWLPGLWRQFPVRGALALLGCFACISASIVVLVISDGEPTSSWKLSPTVYLALLMTGTNMLARYLFNEGVRIAWWHTALRGGTIRDLHNRSSYADSFISAFTSGRQFNLVALGSIAVTIIVIDQPLIQRASSVVPATRGSIANVTASIAPEIPWGFTSYRTSRSTYDQVMTQSMISAFNSYNSQANISASNFSGCNGTCSGYVDAGGLSAQCTTATGPIFYDVVNNIFDSVSPFYVNFQLVESEGDPTPNSISLLMNVAFTNNSNEDTCRGDYTERNCTLVASTLRYPVTIIGDILILDDVLENGMTRSFQPQSTNTDGSEYTFWTLGGLYLAAFALFNSSATYTWEGATGVILALPDTLSTQFIEFSTGNISTSGTSQNFPRGCGTNWTDPTSHILTALNAMSFRLSLAAASAPYRNTTQPPAPQNLTMLQIKDITVFKSNYRFLIASTILTAALIVLIIPTFIGWWELGRRVTLNPIEIAKALDAPSLQGPGSNAPLSGLMARYGARRVRLGEVEDLVSGSLDRRQLKLADPSEVGKPKAGVVYA